VRLLRLSRRFAEEGEKETSKGKLSPDLSGENKICTTTTLIRGKERADEQNRRVLLRYWVRRERRK